MIESIIALLAGFVTSSISRMGYSGIVLLMAIESACIPLPSEIIMPFAGYLVYTGEFSLWGIAVAGALGCVLGSVVAYYVGAYGGRPLVARYGRYFLISPRELAWADGWFQRYGEATVFIARLLPVVRTFIAFPAGVARMPMGRFVAYTFVGSLIWCYGLGWVGLKLGENWRALGPYFHQADLIIGVIGAAAVFWYVRRHLRARRMNQTIE